MPLSNAQSRELWHWYTNQNEKTQDKIDGKLSKDEKRAIVEYNDVVEATPIEKMHPNFPENFRFDVSMTGDPYEQVKAIEAKAPYLDADVNKEGRVVVRLKGYKGRPHVFNPSLLAGFTDPSEWNEDIKTAIPDIMTGVGSNALGVELGMAGVNLGASLPLPVPAKLIASGVLGTGGVFLGNALGGTFGESVKQAYGLLTGGRTQVQQKELVKAGAVEGLIGTGLPVKGSASAFTKGNLLKKGITEEAALRTLNPMSTAASFIGRKLGGGYTPEIRDMIGRHLPELNAMKSAAAEEKRAAVQAGVELPKINADAQVAMDLRKDTYETFHEVKDDIYASIKKSMDEHDEAIDMSSLKNSIDRRMSELIKQSRVAPLNGKAVAEYKALESINTTMFTGEKMSIKGSPEGNQIVSERVKLTPEQISRMDISDLVDKKKQLQAQGMDLANQARTSDPDGTVNSQRAVFDEFIYGKRTKKPRKSFFGPDVEEEVTPSLMKKIDEAAGMTKYNAQYKQIKELEKNLIKNKVFDPRDPLTNDRSSLALEDDLLEIADTPGGRDGLVVKKINSGSVDNDLKNLDMLKVLKDRPPPARTRSTELDDFGDSDIGKQTQFDPTERYAPRGPEDTPLTNKANTIKASRYYLPPEDLAHPPSGKFVREGAKAAGLMTAGGYIGYHTAGTPGFVTGLGLGLGTYATARGAKSRPVANALINTGKAVGAIPGVGATLRSQPISRETGRSLWDEYVAPQVNDYEILGGGGSSYDKLNYNSGGK